MYLHLEPGHYYFFVPARVANGGTLHFGVRGASNVDAYEKTTGYPNYWGNDIGGEGYNVTGDFNYFGATLDNSGDIDNYEYTLEDGVEMVLSVEDGELTAGSVQLEVWAGNFWQPLATNPIGSSVNEFSIAPTQNPQTVHFRVRYADTANKSQGNRWYNLKVGKRIANIEHLTPLSSHSGSGTIINANVASRQFYNQWEWGARIEDSNGDPIQGVVVINYYDVDYFGPSGVGYQYDYGVTDANGEVVKYLNLGCTKGEATNYSILRWVQYGQPDEYWKSYFTKGEYYIEVPQSRYQDEIGIGSSDGIKVSVAQICKQELVGIQQYQPCTVDLCN